MSDQSDNLVRVYLRRIGTRLERMDDDMQDLKRPMTPIGEGVARPQREIAGMRSDYAGPQLRMDCMDTRIERRVELAEVRP